MNPSKRMVRARKNAKCPVCGKPDWCLLGEKWIICMRVESCMPKTFTSGEVGWLHPVSGDYVAPQATPGEEKRPALLDIKDRLAKWRVKHSEPVMQALAQSLGVSRLSLSQLECHCTDRPGVFAFPMRSGDGGYIGIRLRSLSGDKWAERGSQNGLFIPQVDPYGPCYICEGPTDTAALLTMGLYAIGRPSCSAGVNMILEHFRRMRIREAVIISDGDAPGMRGAVTLTEHLKCRSCIVVPPCKDVRKFLQNGGTKELLESLVKQLIWSNPDNKEKGTQ